MAKGFDELIEFLLEEIALRGEQGASTLDFKDLINKFYTQQDQDVRHRGAAAPKPQADRRLQEKVWSWMTAHPDICLSNGQTDGIPSLAEMEALENRQPPTTTEAFEGANASSSEEKDAAPKLYVNEERMWQAITGHGVDPKRIPRHEFIILSIIAAHGEKGVVQPEITRISGQDKRSVPKRTDNLSKHGYITKIHVLAKGTRTSLCTLKRYAKDQMEKRKALPPINSQSTPDQIKAVIFQDGLLLYDRFFDILMDILKECTIMTIEDCKRKLGITTKTWEMKSLWRSMRRLEGLGLVKKVKAQIKGHVASHKWYRCIKLLRQPSQRDRMVFVTMSMKEAKKLSRSAEAGDGDDEDAEGDMEPAEEEDEAGASQALVQQGNDVEEIKRLPPQWDPDRPIINLLWDIIRNTGRAGATTAIIRDQGLGTFYRRPIDSILGRISDIWHISQPKHLRHFAIIRDTGISDKYLHYVYRTYGNFQLAVDVAEAAWEVVITQPVNQNAGRAKPRAKNQKNVRETIHHEYGELDEWGFPRIHESCFEGRNGMATLKDSNKMIMSNLKALPSRGYLPRFITGGYVQSQREASVDSGDDDDAGTPVLPRKKIAQGDKPKRKYTRRSNVGADQEKGSKAKGSRQKRQPRNNAEPAQAPEVGASTTEESTRAVGANQGLEPSTPVTPKRKGGRRKSEKLPDSDVIMEDAPMSPMETRNDEGNAIEVYDGTGETEQQSVVPSSKKTPGRGRKSSFNLQGNGFVFSGISSGPRKKRSKPSLEEPGNAEVVAHKGRGPGVYINPSWGKKPRPPDAKGRPKKAMVVVMVLEALQGIDLNSPEFSAKVEATKVKAALELQPLERNPQLTDAPLLEVEDDAVISTEEHLRSESTHVGRPRNDASRQERPQDNGGRIGLDAQPTNTTAIIEAERNPVPLAEATRSVASGITARPTTSAEPPIFHMLDEMPDGPRLSLHLPTMSSLTESATPVATEAPSIGDPATPTAVATAPKKRGRPRKDPNSLARPRKSAKKNADDTAATAVLNGQGQPLQPSLASSPTGGGSPSGAVSGAVTQTPMPKKRGRKPKAVARLSETPHTPVPRTEKASTEVALAKPAEFNPFVAMAEEYNRSVVASAPTAPQPFNPFVAAAEEHSRSVTSTPAPLPTTERTAEIISAAERRPAEGTTTATSSARKSLADPKTTVANGPASGHFSPSRITPFSQDQRGQRRPSTSGSDRSYSPTRPSLLGQPPVTHGYPTPYGPFTTTSLAQNVDGPSSAATSRLLASIPSEGHSRQLLPRVSSSQQPTVYQSPYAASNAAPRHGGLYDQLRGASQSQQPHYRSPYSLPSANTPAPTVEATKRPENARGPVWGTFAQSPSRTTMNGSPGSNKEAPPEQRSEQREVTVSSIPASQLIDTRDDGSETEDESALRDNHPTPVHTKHAHSSEAVTAQDAEELRRESQTVEHPDGQHSELRDSQALRGNDQVVRAEPIEETQEAPPFQEDVEMEDSSRTQEIQETPSTSRPDSTGRGLAQSQSAIENPDVPQTTPIGSRRGKGPAVDTEFTKAVPASEPSEPRKKGKWQGGKKQGVKLSSGGMLNFNRTKLLVSIIEKCDGVFPGDFEIQRPFVGLWSKEYGAARQVDRDTIKRTIKNAIESGRAKRLTYSFKNKNGVMMTRHILTLPHISPSDPLVLQTQKKVIAAWPRVYTPPQMKEYEEEAGNSWYGDKYEKDTTVQVQRSNLPQWMRDMELRTAENQRKRDKERRRKLERETGSSTRPGQARGSRARISRPRVTGRTGRQRLAGLPRPVIEDEDSPWTSLHPNFYTASAYLQEDEIEEPGSPSRTFDEMAGLFQVNNFIYDNPSYETAYITDDDESSIGSFSRPGTPVTSSRTPRRRDRRLSVASSTSSGAEMPGRRPSFSVQLSPSPSRRNSIQSVASSRASTPSVSSFRLDKHPSQRWQFKNAGPDDYDPTWEIQDIASLTDPDILFYPSTGTFSTEYHVVRNARVSLWVQPRAQHQQDFEDAMPRSLEQLLGSVRMKGKERDHSRRGNENLSKFEREIIVVSHWEDQQMRKSEDLGLVVKQPHFINHNFFGEHEEPERETPSLSLQWANPYSQKFTPFEPPPFDETDESDTPGVFISETWMRRRRTIGGDGSQPAKRRKRKSTVNTPDGRMRRQRQPRTSAPKSHLSRGPTQNPLCKISTADTKKLLYAMVVVQSLLGGLEAYTSWDQIRRIFKTHEHWDLTSFRNRWVWLKTHCADVIESLFDEFQSAYLLAYECGDVPTLDYDNVDDYDWEGIVDWTMQNISIKPPKEADPYSDLPATRQDLDKLFTVEEDNEWSGPPKETLYNESTLSTRRRELTQTFSFYVPLTQRPQPKEKPPGHGFSRSELERAKTWVRATIVVPDEQFDKESFGRKLQTLDNKLVDKATSELVSSKYFRDEQKGRTKPGRNYGMDRTFPKTFDRQLLPAQLFEAMQFKAELDNAFTNGAESYPLLPSARDGHVLAAVNLARSGYVKISPCLPPVDHTIGKPFPRLTKFGFTEGHYKTVQMDRGNLTWGLDIVPTDKYVHGNPLLKARGWDQLPPAPLPDERGDNNGFIPLWYDLFSRPIRGWWPRVVVAIVHIVFGRPGVGISGISRGLKDAMATWEIELCVGWLVKVGALTDNRLGLEDWEQTRGWRLGEWWWCVLGDGST